MTQVLRRAMMAMVMASVVGAVSCVAHAADVTVGTDIASAYVWRGVTFNDDGVLQPSVDVTHESGVNLNVWANMDLGSYGGRVEEGNFSEVDFSLSYAFPIEEFDLSAGVIHYMFPQSASGADTSTTELTTSVGFSPIDAVSLGADLYWDVQELNSVYAFLGGSLDLLSFAGDSAPEGLGLELSTGIGLAGDEFAKAYGGTDGGAFDWNISAAASYALNDSVELTGYVMYTDSADTDALPNQEVDVLGGVGVYYTF